MSKKWNATPEELARASEGDLCPACKSTKVLVEDCNPDGINMNWGYTCADCGEQWEGN